jgi:hypothetical protein
MQAIVFHQDMFLEIGPDGGFVHFRKPASRALIQQHADAYGWPLIGIYISGSGSTPDYIKNRLEFPTPTGGGNLADKVQTAIDNDMEEVFLTGDARHFWAKCHVFVYRPDKLYTLGDYTLLVSDGEPPADWWKPFSERK